MIIYTHDKNAEPLLGLLRRLEAGNDLTPDERDAVQAVIPAIVVETGRAPYRLWLKEKQTAERLLLTEQQPAAVAKSAST